MKNTDTKTKRALRLMTIAVVFALSLAAFPSVASAEFMLPDTQDEKDKMLQGFEDGDCIEMFETASLVHAAASTILDQAYLADLNGNEGLRDALVGQYHRLGVVYFAMKQMYNQNGCNGRDGPGALPSYPKV